MRVTVQEYAKQTGQSVPGVYKKLKATLKPYLEVDETTGRMYINAAAFDLQTESTARENTSNVDSLRNEIVNLKHTCELITEKYEALQLVNETMKTQTQDVINTLRGTIDDMRKALEDARNTNSELLKALENERTINAELREDLRQSRQPWFRRLFAKRPALQSAPSEDPPGPHI